MTLIRFTILALALTFTAQLQAEEIKFGKDGWYSWEVDAGKDGRKSCCYTYSNGNVYNKGCKLGNDGDNGYTINEPCDALSDTMRIYVEVKNGTVRDIRPLSSNCPVQSGKQVITFEDVTTRDSIAWLEDQMHNNRKVSEEAIMALSFHSKEQALGSLIRILEDRDEKRDNREEALFWLVQSDYDEAYTYLDDLLN